MSNKNIVNKERNMFVDDDSVTYNIRNKQGKLLGKFEFHPSDTNIVERFGEVVDYFNNLTLPDNNDEAIKVAEKEMSVRTKKLQRRTNKYVRKYHK